ncbi:MAG: translation elongation factor 4 [Patescibacteria group bacterium UBA2163]
MKTDHIRNFSIIAHIDHGKSTLADRMLEITKSVEMRKMREQMLDAMDLERERGITIKMQPARMHFSVGGEEYVLNLIDTPGHIDFAYEVSRALTAVEGVLLLVDATQGVQAQTLATLAMAKEAGCVIIPVISKTDMPNARIAETQLEIIELLNCDESDIYLVSGKTGSGVEELLDGIVKTVPPPTPSVQEHGGRALIFDFSYSEHRGVVMFIRVTDGTITTKDTLSLAINNHQFQAGEVGWFLPEPAVSGQLTTGEIGYVVSGLKEPGIAVVGDTLTSAGTKLPALPGYKQPKPVVWASLFPESQDEFVYLKQALARLQLSDSALSFEEDGSSVLGKGFRCGFLGMLHLEIVTERLRREFKLTPILTTPSIMYDVVYKDGTEEVIFSPSQFPDHGSLEKVFEQWTRLTIIAPPEYLSGITQLIYEHEGQVATSELFSDGRMSVTADMPLRELMRGFFDRLKSVSSGFASLSYEFTDKRPADVTRLDVLVAEEAVPAFSRVVSRSRAEEDARSAVEKLNKTLPKQLFVVKIQAKADGRIIASKSLSAMRKDVTGHLYGGDVSRKKKLLEKQKKGKERRGSHGKVSIPPDVFLKMVNLSDE